MLKEFPDRDDSRSPTKSGMTRVGAGMTRVGAGMTRVGAGMTKKDLLLYKLILLIPGMHGCGYRVHFGQKNFGSAMPTRFFDTRSKDVSCNLRT